MDDERSPGDPAAAVDDAVVDVSVVICTRDRVERLALSMDAALVSLDQVRSHRVELVVVDNASTDETSLLVARWADRDPRVRLVLAPDPGIGRARAVGVGAAKGRVILFTDDDVVVPPEWAAALSTPLLDGQAEVVAGGVVMAPELEREWMTESLKSRYYAHVPVPPEHSPGLAGASMGATREVLARIPFDDQLGTQAFPGAEDVLLYVQALELGYRIRGVAGAAVEHRFDPARLEAARLRVLAEGYGRCDAYFFHHWLHTRLSLQRLRVLAHRTRLAVTEMRIRDGHDERLVEAARQAAFHRELLALRHVARRYGYRGERVVA